MSKPDDRLHHLRLAIYSLERDVKQLGSDISAHPGQGLLQAKLRLALEELKGLREERAELQRTTQEGANQPRPPMPRSSK